MKRLKKNFLFIVSLFFVALLSNGQQTDPKFFAEVFTGPSLPAGKFGDKKFSGNPTEKNPSGLAKPGVNVNISAGYHFKPFFGAMLSVAESFNKQDPGSYEDYFKQTTGNNSRAEVKTSSWKILKIMAGGFYSTPVSTSSKLEFQTRMTAGLCKTSIPGYRGVIYDQNGMVQGAFSQSKKSLPWSLCFEAGIGLQYWLDKKIHTLFDVSYFDSNPGLKYSYDPNFPSPGPLISGKNNYSLSSFNILFGIGVIL